MRQILLLTAMFFIALSAVGASSCGNASDSSPPPPEATPESTATVNDTPTKAEPSAGADDCDCAPRQSLAPLVSKLQPSVVNIYTTKLRATYNPLAPLFSLPPRVTKERSLGSGFVFNASEGLVVTNHHVVTKAHEVKVRLSDRRELSATVLGGDPDIDLALLRVSPAKSLQQVDIGDSDDLQVGDWVLAIGNPFGLSQTVTLGIVSALSRTIGAGSLRRLHSNRRLHQPRKLGRSSLRYGRTSRGDNTAIHREGQGIGFAIPMSMARPLIEQIHRTGRVVRVHLGVVIQDVTPDLSRAMNLSSPHGALVAEVLLGSPAAQAGVQPGDIIVSFNDHDIRVSRNLPTQVARTRPGQTVPLVVLRGGQRHTLQATMVARPAPQTPSRGPLTPWPTWPRGPRRPYGQGPRQQPPYGQNPRPAPVPRSPYGP